MNYLFKLGYRRIGYLHYGGTVLYYYPIHALRLTDYYRLMAENGLKVEPGWVFHCSEHYENLPEGMDRILHSDPPPEALITPGSALRLVYFWCRKHHVRIGEDLAIFSTDDVNGNLDLRRQRSRTIPERSRKHSGRCFRRRSAGKRWKAAARTSSSEPG